MYRLGRRLYSGLFTAAEYLGQIDDAQIYRQDGDDHIHVPVIIGDDLLEQRQQGIFRHNGVHIVHLNQVAGIVEDVVGGQICIESQVAQMHGGVDGHGDADGGKQVFGMLFDDSQGKQQDRVPNSSTGGK